MFRDINIQFRRGIKSSGFLFSVLLMFYSLFFVHTDVNYSIVPPHLYFGMNNFYYFFIISFWLGLSQFVLPIVGILPFGFFLVDDETTGFGGMASYRKKAEAYIGNRLLSAMLTAAFAVLSSVFIFTVFLLFVTSMEGSDAGWIEAMKNSSFEWMSTPDHFIYFVLSQYGRMMLSAAIWAAVAVGFSALWSNRAFVFLATFATSIILDTVIGGALGEEYTLTWLQTPDLSTTTPFKAVLVRQLCYLLGAVCFASLGAAWRFSKTARRLRQRVAQRRAGRTADKEKTKLFALPVFARGNAMGRLWSDVRGFCCWPALASSLIIPVVVMLMGRRINQAGYSIGDLLMETFGGSWWQEPPLNFRPIGIWVLTLMPPVMGMAINLQRELGTRMTQTLYRHPSKMAWWRSKCLASVFYTLVCTIAMFLSVMVAGGLLGADGIAIYIEDSDGFATKNVVILLTLFVIFLGQVLMLTQLQMLVHLVSGSMQLAVLSYIMPLIVSLIFFSLFDRAVNIHSPYNWGMLLRTELFSPQFMEGDGEPFPLASIPLNMALRNEYMAALGLFILNLLCIKPLKVTQRQLID